MSETSYAIALGSNRRSRHGTPADTLRAAVTALDEIGTVERVSPIRATPALGPAGRSFANAALLIRTRLLPDDLLTALKHIERDFGRRRGRRWGPRVLDLDILLWSEGLWLSTSLTVPHPAIAARRFVLDPLLEIAPDWRLPASSLTIRHLHYRFERPRPVDPIGPRS